MLDEHQEEKEVPDGEAELSSEVAHRVGLSWALGSKCRAGVNCRVVRSVVVKVP